jgi:hypothetical protein
VKEFKTKVNNDDVLDFIAQIPHPTRQQDAKILFDIYSEVTQQSAKMWGASIVGFCEYTYINSSNKPQTWMRAAFSPRKQYMSLYLMLGVQKNPDVLQKLGKFKHGKSCLNINKLADVDLDVLKQLVALDWESMNKKYP